MSEEATFNLVLKDVRESGRLVDDQKEVLERIFGSRFAAAYKVIEEGKVRKYVFQPSGRVVWIVAGRERDYQILPLAKFCSCFDFYFRVISNEISFCYHLIAQRLAETLGRYVVIEESDSNFKSFMEKWRETVGRRRELSIEEVENVRKVAIEVLLVEKELPIGRLLQEVVEAGYVTLTTGHLANILTADRAKRFKCTDGSWTLSSVNVK